LISEAERAEMEKGALRQEDILLNTMVDNPGASFAALAEAAGWRFISGKNSGKPYKSLVQRLMRGLEKDHLVKSERGAWRLTDKGLKEAGRVKFQADVASVRNG